MKAPLIEVLEDTAEQTLKDLQEYLPEREWLRRQTNDQVTELIDLVQTAYKALRKYKVERLSPNPIKFVRSKGV